VVAGGMPWERWGSVQVSELTTGRLSLRREGGVSILITGR